MSSAHSFSTLPEAPTAHGGIQQFIRSRSRPEDEPKPDTNQVPLYPLIPPIYSEPYPKLALQPYHINQESKGTNVLAFLHNGAKREIADLVSVVIPAFENQAKLARENTPLSEADGFGEEFQNWWNLLLRFFFFVAETNLEIMRLMAEPVERLLMKEGDYKLLNAIQKQRKSMTDRYEFTMEVVFRAADRALSDLQAEKDPEKIMKLVEKLEALARFVLDTLQHVMNLATQLESIAPDLEVNGLEYVIRDNLSVFAREEKPVLLYTCARWMEDEAYVKPWIIKYGGMWGRMMFKSWQNAHKEKRSALVDKLHSRNLSV